MSVDTCLVRVTALELKGLERHPESFTSFISDLRDKTVFFNPNLDDPVERVLYVDEFIRSLLTDMTALEEVFEPLNRALMFGGHVLGGESIGPAAFHMADEVKGISRELADFSEGNLRELVFKHAAEFRMVTVGFLDSDEAILAYQKGHFDRLSAFYRGAAQQGDAMLLLVV